MANNNSDSEGVVIDSELIVRVSKYYAIIGGGLGLLGIVLLSQFGGGDSGAIMGAILSLVILTFAVLSGPIIAAIVGFATAQGEYDNIKERAVNSGIANGIGFALFGIIVAVFLLIGLAVIVSGGNGGTGTGGSGSSGPIEVGNLITLIVLMIIPNALVGSGITFFLEDRTGVPIR